MVEFVSYKANALNLCEGVLTLRIDGKEVRFGNNEENPEFWASGGLCHFLNGHEEAEIVKAPWEIYREHLPENLKQYYEEIEQVFNDNVPYGCCGGCL